MAHTHDVQKVKNNQNTELASTDTGVITFVNIAGRTVSVGSSGVLLYPGDTAVSCACHPEVTVGVKSRKYKIISQSEPQAPAQKSRKTKAEEPAPVEETFATVADPEPASSVQLDSSDESETQSGEEL